ncbi:MAG TPA: hypothetical protein VGJ18_08580 [Gemmatimonadaceae bacterium]|jgi:hypothetical protein
MNARVARSITRLDNIASELDLTVKSLAGRNVTTKLALELKSAPPTFDHSVIEFRSVVNQILDLAHKESSLTPQEAREGEKTADLKKRLRWEYMIRLRRNGKRLLRFAPGVEKALKVPHAHASHRELVTAAEVMLKAVQPYRKIFISAGFSKTFFTELRDLTKDLKRIATTTSQRQAKFEQVTDAISEELATAYETLGIIEGLVLARAFHNSRLAKVWKELMKHPTRMGRPPAKKQKLSPSAMLAASRGLERRA